MPNGWTWKSSGCGNASPRRARLHRDSDKVKAASGPRGRSPRGNGADANFQIHDLRDMLTVLRTLEIKPAAGRRRDLKKIEAAVEDLRMLVERWG